MKALEIICQGLSGCMLLSAVLTIEPALEPKRRKQPQRFFYIFVRYALPAWLLFLVAYWFLFGRLPG